jgi:predicted chitinase
MLADRAADTAPAIRPDIGADIVAAMAKNTQAIITLVDTTEKQTQSGVNIAEKQAQAQDTILSRQKASKEEKALEQGEDLSGFMTPEKIMKAIKPPKSKDGGGEKDGKGGGLPLMGGGKGLAGKAGKLLGPVAKWTAIIGTGLLAGMSLGTHLWHQNNDRKKANAPKSDRLGNLLDDDGNVLSGPSAPTQDEQFVDNNTGERYDSPLPDIEPVEDPNKNPGYNQGGLVSGGKANLVDDVPIRADEGEVVMSNRAGNMFGRGALMSMNAVAGSTNTPSSGGGYAQGGTVGVSSQSRKMYKAFGQGIVDAQLDEKKKLAEIQGEGLRTYFETKGGFEKLGEGLKSFFEGLAGGIGSLFSSLLGGPAQAAPSTSGADYLTDGSAEGNKKALYAAMKDAGFNDKSASNMLAQLEGESGFKAQSEQSYKNTSAANIRKAMGNRAAGYTDAQLDSLKLDDKKFFDAMYGNDMGNAADEGHKYRGRGFIQLTGKENYKKIGDMIGVDLVKNPDLLNTDNSIAAKAAIAFFQSVGANNDNMSTMTGAYNAVYRGGANKTYLDSKDKERVATRGARANKFLSQMQSGDLTTAASSPGSSAGGGQLADAAESLRGMSTKDGPGGGSRSCVFAVNKVFAKAGIQPPWGAAQNTLDAINGMKGAGWNEVGFENAQPGDVWVYDNGVDKGHVGIKTSDGRVLSNGSSSASFSWSADQAELLKWYPDAGGLTPPGGTFYRPPGGGEPQVASTGAGGASPLTADQKSKMFQKAGMPQLAAKTLSAPGPLPAKSASPQTGTPIMATSAQVASASGVGAAPTIINNYYSSGGGQQNGTPTPNSVATGINMNDAGLSAFNELKLRTS